MEKVKLVDGPDGHFVPLDEFFSYWEPPAINVNLKTISMTYLDMKGIPLKTKHMFGRSEVELAGEFSAIDVNTEGLKEELQEAIDKIISKRTKPMAALPRGTSIETKEDKDNE